MRWNGVVVFKPMSGWAACCKSMDSREMEGAETSASSSHKRRRSVKAREIADTEAGDTSSSCYCRNESLVVKEVVKPISYAAKTTVDGNKDVLILFQALRANGKEVIVDNKFLRESYPLMLLDFYERNLNYDKPELLDPCNNSTVTPTDGGNGKSH